MVTLGGVASALSRLAFPVLLAHEKLPPGDAFMEFHIYQAIAALLSLTATAVVVELIRRRKIQDVLWLPWLAAALFPAGLGFWQKSWASFAQWLGIRYEPLLLVALASLVSFGMLLHLSVVVSALIRKNLRLAQEIALLRQELEQVASAPPGVLANGRIGAPS